MIPTQLASPACVPDPAIVATRRAAAHSRLALLGMSLLVLATWLLVHPYAGLVHDSIVYTLMALARLHPQSLSHDIFLRFGSQDQYTIFGPVFSATIRMLDLEPAAAVLTLVSQVAFFVFAWLLARRLLAGTTALLATGLLLALPSAYGSADFFHYTENFLTPRLPAEALVLAAIAAALAQRYVWAALAVLAALLLHPIMGAAGVALLVLTFAAIPRPRLALGCGAALLAVSVVASLLGVAPFTRFEPADAQWLSIVSSTSPFLFVTGWSSYDWARAALILAVPAVGLLTADTRPLRNLCAGALLTGVSGLALTALYCDALRVILVTELQPWRWLWLTQVLAILLAPLIARNCTRAGSTARAAVLLLAGAWLFRDDWTRALCAVLAVLCAAGRNAAVAKNHERVIYRGAGALLVMAVVLSQGERLLFAANLSDSESHASRFLDWLRFWDSDGLLPAGVLILAWWALERADSLARTAAIATGCALACVVLVPSAWNAWTAGQYTQARRAAFNTWRKEIPADAEVLWPVNPVGAWYLLERPSYWSQYQAVGAVFSKPKALELDRRNLTLGALATPTSTDSSVSVESVEAGHGRPVASPFTAIIRDKHSVHAACQNRDLGYVVSWNLLGPSPVEPVVFDPSKPGKRMYLYRCTDFRQSP